MIIPLIGYLHPLAVPVQQMNPMACDNPADRENVAFPRIGDQAVQGFILCRRSGKQQLVILPTF